MKIRGRWLILVCVVVVAGLLVAWGLNRSTPAQHFTARVERGAINDVVEATGTITRSLPFKWGRKSRALSRNSMSIQFASA